MICKKCGAELQEDALVCEVCGEAVENEEVEVVAETEEVVTEAIEEVTVDEQTEEIAEEIEATVVEEEEPAKKSAFVRVGIPVILVAVIAIVCVVSMFFMKNSNKIVARAEYKVTEATPGPSGEPASDSVGELKFFDKDIVVKIDKKLYSYYVGQIVGSMQQQYAQYGLNVDSSMLESVYDTQIYESAIGNAKIVKLFEMKADEYNYELPEELKTELENELKAYVESLVDADAGETFDSAKDEIIRNLYGISYDDFLESALRINRVADFLENCPEMPEITEEMMTEYYDLYKDSQFTTRKVKHILISTMDESGKALGKKAMADKKALAEKLAKQINDGANIDELIKKHTADVDAAGSPNNNGEYEITQESSFVEEFKNWALSHSTEDKAEVVKTQYGYHVMKMSEYKVTSYEEAKGMLRGMYISEEGSTFAQAMEITYKNEDALNDCKAAILGTLPTPAPVEAETTAEAEATVEATPAQ